VNIITNESNSDYTITISIMLSSLNKLSVIFILLTKTAYFHKHFCCIEQSDCSNNWYREPGLNLRETRVKSEGNHHWEPLSEVCVLISLIS